VTPVLAAILVAVPATELVVYAAASLRESFETIARGFEVEHPGTRVLLSFGGSQGLRAQIENGAPADVFVSADQPHMDALVKQGLALAPRVIARNSLAIVVPPGNPDKVAGLADLSRLERIALAAPEVPAGAYAREALRKLGLEARVEAKAVSRELNVRQVAGKVALGEAQAGIVYHTDALAFRGKLDEVPIAAKENVAAHYPAAALKPSAHPDLARQFVEYLVTKKAQDALAAAGFK
jgi:molybdate transport system substrate-binding protein